MFIDVDLLYSLQVLPETSKRKRCLLSHLKRTLTSLLDYLDKTATKGGQQLLRSWIVSPLNDLDGIIERQNTVELLIESQNQEITLELQTCLKLIGNVNASLSGLKAGKGSWSHWKNVMKFLDSTARIQQLASSLKSPSTIQDTPTIIKAIISIDATLFRQMLGYFYRYIDIDISNENGEVEILSNVDDTLDELRSIYENLESILKDALKDIAGQLPNELSTLVNTAYIPQIGFLSSLEWGTDSNELLVTLCDHGWQEVFRTETTIYFKMLLVSELDEKYGDIYELVCDRQIELSYDLQNALLEEEYSISSAFKLLTELDCYISMAQTAKESGLIRPSMVDSKQLQIVKGRHPLFESHVPMFIPNNTSLDYDEMGEVRIALLTGANYSGKSVYLSQVALIIILAQIGCFIPAEKATIGLVDKILTRVMSRETIEKRQSTFAIDVHQLSKSLAFATESSILIIDEFGKGSDAIDGAALFGSTIKYLNDMKDGPRVICSTHFHELFKKQFSIFGGPRGLSKVRFYYMDVTKNEAKDNSELITYLYQLKDGISFSSFGHYCARMNDIPSCIVDRAENLASKLIEGFDLLQEFATLTEEEEACFFTAKSMVVEFLSIKFSNLEHDDAELELQVQKYLNLVNDTK